MGDFRNKIRITNHEDFLHHRQDSTVSVVVRKKVGRKKLSHDVREVNISLMNRQPNVENVVLFNLDRAIKDLQEVRDDIAKKDLYNNFTVHSE